MEKSMKEDIEKLIEKIESLRYEAGFFIPKFIKKILEKKANKKL